MMSHLLQSSDSQTHQWPDFLLVLSSDSPFMTSFPLGLDLLTFQFLSATFLTLEPSLLAVLFVTLDYIKLIYTPK